MQTIQKKGLTVKDLVTIGIFSALFLVFALVGGMLAGGLCALVSFALAERAARRNTP